MTKHVLLLGVICVALSAFIWVVFNGYNDTRFTGLLFKLWFVCLLIAMVSDAVIHPAAKRAVSAFAASLSNEVGQVGCKVTQYSGWRADLRTTTSGSFHERRTTVLVFQQPRISYLKLEMVCLAPWVVDIRRRNLASGSVRRSILATKPWTKRLLFRGTTRSPSASGQSNPWSRRGFSLCSKRVESPP